MCSTDCSASCKAPPPLASPSRKFMLHKDGSPKDANATFTFMRRSAKIREELRAITMLQRVDTFIKSREVKNRNHWVQWTIVTDE